MNHLHIDEGRALTRDDYVDFSLLKIEDCSLFVSEPDTSAIVCICRCWLQLLDVGGRAEAAPDALVSIEETFSLYIYPEHLIPTLRQRDGKGVAGKRIRKHFR